MDPNHWNLSQAYAARLPPNASALGANSRFELLDQAALSAAQVSGLSGISAPSAHASGLASVNYGLHTAMPSYLDPAVLASQAYKGIPVSQPYGLDHRGPPELIRYPASTVSPPSVTSKALYTDPRADPLAVPMSYGTLVPEPKYLSVSSGGLVGVPGNDVYSSPLMSVGLGGLQPPPAHSGSGHSVRASTIQRNPYQPDKYDPASSTPRPDYATKSPYREMLKHEQIQKESVQKFAEPSHVGFPDPSRLQAGAAPVYQSPSRNSAYSEPGRPAYDPPLPASTSYEESRISLYEQRPPTTSYASVTSKSFIDTGQLVYHDVPRTTGYQEVAMSSYVDSHRASNSMYPSNSPPVPQNRGSYPNSPQMAGPQVASTVASHYPNYSSPTAQSFANKKPGYVGGRQYGTGYDAMSPEAQQPPAPDSRYSTIAYSDLDMKQPNSGMHGNAAAMGPGYQEMSPVAGSQQPSPLSGASHHSPGMHHSPHKASPIPHLPQQPSPHQPSPVQPSPIHHSPMGAGSPQVPMGSPQAVSNALPQPPAAVVQAVADSTTKPPKRQRRRKSDKAALPPPAKIPAMQPGLYEMPGKNYIPAGYGGHYPAGYEAHSPGMTPVGSPGMQHPPHVASMPDYSAMPGQQHHPASPGQPLMHHPHPASPGQPLMHHPQPHSPYPPTTEYSSVAAMHEHMQDYQHPLPGPHTRPQFPLNEASFVKSEFGPGHAKVDSPPTSELQSGAPLHLKQEPGIPVKCEPGLSIKLESKAVVTMDPDDEFAHLAASPKVSANNDDKSVDKKSKTFLNSYLSFIQGEKGETLTSVKNSDMSLKPELPKYVPEPRPPGMRLPPDDPMFEADTDSNSSAPKNDSKATAVAVTNKADGSGENSVTPMSMSQELAMMVNLDSVNIAPEPEIPEELPTFDLEMERRQLAEQLQKLKKGKKKKKQTVFVSRPANQLALKDGEKLFTVSDSSISDASVDLEEPEVASSPESIVDQKGYDSDKDPVWRPGAKRMPRKLTTWNSSGSEDESWAPAPRGSKSRARGRGRGGAKGRGRGRGGRGGGRAKVPQPPMVPLVKFPKGPNVPRGEFVVEKNDINLPRYPIWKIDGGRLLQKFEPFECDGRIRHKPMTTYSSWAESVRHKFHHIKVTLICQARGKEIVEVVKSSLVIPDVQNSPVKMDSPVTMHKPSPSHQGSQVLPPLRQPEASAEDRSDGGLDLGSEEEDPLLHPFNVYMQILISQALEPGFLGAILEEGDDYYKDPQHKIDTLLVTKKDLLAECLQWSPKLKTAVECSPFLNVSDRHMYANDNLQSIDPSQVKSVRVHGNPYIRETLDLLDDENFPSQEFPVEPLLAQQVELYHRLHHFKFIVYQKCLAKVASIRCANSNVENRDILDRCLQDRGWVQKLLQELYEITRSAADLTVKPS